jgi:ornithine carbamoyltransferase
VKKDFLSIADLSSEEITDLFQLARKLKEKTKKGQQHHPLAGKSLVMIFQKPSARTRVSFETGMFQLGGHAIYLGPSEIGLGKRESAADVARVFSRYNDGIMARLFGHDLLLELAEFATIPVINGLTDFNHPCQVLGDILTVEEHLERSSDFSIAYIGDGNNMVHSWLNAASRLPMQLNLAIPEGYDPDAQVLKTAHESGCSEIKIFRDPQEAVRNVDIIYTDVWASMGQEKEAARRKKAFKNFQINTALITASGNKNVRVMHCLPAHRGDEITDDVMDGNHAIVFDEAENRLHIQKAIMVELMAGHIHG